MSAGLALFVTDVDALGGSERQTLLLARTLARRGVPVDVITSTSPGLLTPPRRWVEARDGARVVRLPRLLVEPAAGALLAARRDALRGLVATGLMMGAIAARVGRALDLPVVVKLAGAGEAGDVAALRRLPSPDRAAVLADLRTTRVVCVTEELAREARAAGLPHERLERLPNGVDLEAAAAAAPAHLHDGLAVLFLGRLDHAKGADTLVRAFSEVAPRAPTAALLIAGEGPERGRLERLMHDLGLAGRVRFLGRRADPLELLRGAAVVALPSRSEGMSNTLLEAMAAGRCVVASAIAANAEVAGDAALLVPPDDPAALGRALLHALGDAGLRGRLGEAARARAERFSIERVAQGYLALLDRLGPPPRRGRLELLAGLARARARDVARVVGRARWSAARAAVEEPGRVP